MSRVAVVVALIVLSVRAARPVRPVRPARVATAAPTVAEKVAAYRAVGDLRGYQLLLCACDRIVRDDRFAPRIETLRDELWPAAWCARPIAAAACAAVSGTGPAQGADEMLSRVYGAPHLREVLARCRPVAAGLPPRPGDLLIGAGDDPDWSIVTGDGRTVLSSSAVGERIAQRESCGETVAAVAVFRPVSF